MPPFSDIRTTTSPLPEGVRAVVFDAVGTLIFPQPSVADAYRHAISQHCGVNLPAEAVSEVIREALFQRSEGDLRTGEPAEREFWAGLIRQLCPDPSGFQACFDHLFEHFASAASWRCFPETQQVLEGLAAGGYGTAIASNFDLRLHSVCDGLPELDGVDERVISSVVGWRKPAPEFFSAVSRQMDLPPEKILFVGDDLINDVQGALDAGMQSAWICRSDSSSALPDQAIRIASLKELTE